MADMELNGVSLNIRFLDAAGNEVAISSERIATLATTLFEGIGSDFLNQLRPDGSLYKSQNTVLDNSVLKRFNGGILGRSLDTKETSKQIRTPSQDDSTKDDSPQTNSRYSNVPFPFKTVVKILQKLHILAPDNLQTEPLSKHATSPVPSRNTDSVSSNEKLDALTKEKEIPNTDESITDEEFEKALDEFTAKSYQDKENAETTGASVATKSALKPVEEATPPQNTSFHNIPKVFQIFEGFLQKTGLIKPREPELLYTEPLDERVLPNREERFSTTIADQENIEHDEVEEESIFAEMKFLSEEFMKESRDKVTATTRKTITAQQLGMLTDIEIPQEEAPEAYMPDKLTSEESEPLLAAADITLQ